MPRYQDLRVRVDLGAGLTALATGSATDAMELDIVRGFSTQFNRRVARVGYANVRLRNSSQKYSPDSASALAGFVTGADCDIQVQYGGTWYTLFAGIVDDILPASGVRGERTTVMRCVDHIDLLSRAKVGVDALETDVRANTLINTLVNAVYTPSATDYETGQSVFGYVGFRHNASVLQAIADLCDSELFPACFYELQNGTLRFEDRHNRRLDTTVDWTLDGDMAGLGVSRRRRDIFSRVAVTNHPATVGASPEVLGAYTSAPRLDAGETKTFRIPYRDPDNEMVKSMLGTDVITVAATTDMTANAAADGTGADLTANIDIDTHDKGANASDVTLTNNGATAYITKLQVRGTAVRFYTDEVAYSDAVGAVANVLELDGPFQDNLLVAQNWADWIASEWGGETSTVESLYVRPSNSDLMDFILQADVGDRAKLSETQTGISEGEFFLNSKSVRVPQPGYIEAEFELEWGEVAPLWVLGVSLLGQGTYLG